MSCKEFRELLSPYLDGILPDYQQHSLENHLRHCPDCREELVALRRTVSLLHAWAEEELDLPEGFEKRWRSRLEASRRRTWHLPQGWLPLAAAAITMAVALAAVADSFSFPWSSRSRQQVPGIIPEDTAGVETFAAPAAPAPLEEYSIKVFDQQNITPSSEEMKAPAAGPQPAGENKAAPKSPPRPVVNGRERSPEAPPVNNFRGQKQETATDGSSPPCAGEAVFPEAPPSDGDTPPEEGDNKDEDPLNNLPGGDNDGAIAGEGDGEASVPEDVYQSQQLLQITPEPLPPATEPEAQEKLTLPETGAVSEKSNPGVLPPAPAPGTEPEDNPAGEPE